MLNNKTDVKVGVEWVGDGTRIYHAADRILEYNYNVQLKYYDIFESWYDTLVLWYDTLQ